jgi:integrase
LYLDPGRKVWVIRDGYIFLRLGLPESERAAAEKRLAAYLSEKHQPERGPNPLIADVIGIFATEHLAYAATARNSAYSLGYLLRWWGDRRASAITPANCRSYVAAATSVSTARKDLELLKAALRHYTKSTGVVLQAAVWLPPKEPPRERWMTRSEAARLLKAAKPFPHLRRFILLGLATGSRPKNLFGLTWAQIDLEAGIMRRRPYREREQSRKRAPKVRLGRRILSHLRRWRRLDPHATHVVHWNGKPIAQFSNTWPIVLRAAGLEGDGVTLHTLRHTRATWLLQKGVDAWQVAGHLGMTLTTLQRTYGHHHPAWQKDAAEA